MTKRATDPRNQGTPRERQRDLRWIPWFSSVLASATAIAVLGAPPPTQAGNGEPPSGQGLYSPSFCSSDFAMDCDDRVQDANQQFVGNIVSCHMRGPQGDEGFAQKACIDGRIAIGSAASVVGERFLEENVTVRATDFGGVFYGREPDQLGHLIGYCVLCETLQGAATSKKGTPAGARKCVKIVNDAQTNAPGTCGAFNVTNDTTGACSLEVQQLQQTFSDPRVGFFVNMNGSDVGKAGAKDLVLCGRSWECVDNPSETQTAAQQPQTEAHIDTPCCMKLLSGAWYCSSTLKTSATCK